MRNLSGNRTNQAVGTNSGNRGNFLLREFVMIPDHLMKVVFVVTVLTVLLGMVLVLFPFGHG